MDWLISNRKFKKPSVLVVLLGLGFFLVATIPGMALSDSGDPAPRVSGEIVNGLRVIPLPRAGAPFEVTVYRGDYVVFQPSGFDTDQILAIPKLDIHQTLAKEAGSLPYFKMKIPGVYDFTLGSVPGRIQVLDYRHRSYHEISAAQAAQRMTQNAPLILDVRTPREFQQGHIADAKLLPVQELQRRLGELQVYKDQEILIYCATGNRSTVASKILADQGFENIYNMRGGIREWLMDKRPVER